MKKNKLHKSLRAIFAASAICAALFTTVACSNIIEKDDIEQHQDITKQTQNNKPVLKIKFDETARTVFPTCPVSDLQNFSLTIKKGSENAVAIGEASYVTAEAFQNAEITLDETYVGSTCTFTLSAKYIKDAESTEEILFTSSVNSGTLFSNFKSINRILSLQQLIPSGSPITLYFLPFNLNCLFLMRIFSLVKSGSGALNL